MKQNLAKLFYDFSKIIFGAGVVIPIVQERFDLLVFISSFVVMVVLVMVGVVIDLSSEEEKWKES